MPTTAEQWDGVAGDAKTLESGQIQQGVGEHYVIMAALASLDLGPTPEDAEDRSRW